MPTQAGTTITPGTSLKTAVASGRYTTGYVYVAGDSNLVASNIKSGVSIFGVTGNLQPLSSNKIQLVNNTSDNAYAYFIDYATDTLKRLALRPRTTSEISMIIGMLLISSNLSSPNFSVSSNIIETGKLAGDYDIFQVNGSGSVTIN